MLTLMVACNAQGPSSGSRPDSRPNVLLVTIDALRADRLDRMSFLKSLAERGLRFDRAYATASWTAPSLASLLTGRYPARHGVEVGHLREHEIVAQPALPPDLPLLSERLQAAGYRTFGITANLHAESALGFGRGFGRYRCLGFVEGDAVLEALSAWREEILASEPWFVWLHWLDPHAPYRPRTPFFVGRQPEQFRWLAGVVPAHAFAKHRVEPGPSLAYVERLYDSEVAFVDAELARAYAQIGADDGTLVVVTADHGEEFLDHGEFGHGHSLYEETLRVPLVVKLPDGSRAAEVSDVPVSLVDVMPTILQAAGIEAPPGPGIPLQELDAVAGARDRVLYARIARGRRQRSAVLGDHKLVDGRSPTGGAELWRVYPEVDRPEVPVRDEALRDALAARLDAHEREARATRTAPNPRVPLDPDRAEALRELGYAE